VTWSLSAFRIRIAANETVILRQLTTTDLRLIVSWSHTIMGRLRKRIAKNKLVGLLVTVTFVLLLPIILPLVLILDGLRTRKIKRIVCDFICVSCGTQLGVEALRLGNERWAAIISDLHKQYPGMRFRIVRDIHAVCPNCGCEYMYRDADCSLAVRPQPECA
jgi:hypothetical protein